MSNSVSVINFELFHAKLQKEAKDSFMAPQINRTKFSVNLENLLAKSKVLRYHKGVLLCTYLDAFWLWTEVGRLQIFSAVSTSR